MIVSTSTMLDKHTPLTMNRVTQRQTAPWYDNEVENTKFA